MDRLPCVLVDGVLFVLAPLDKLNEENSKLLEQLVGKLPEDRPDQE